MEEIDFVIGNKDKNAVANFVEEIHNQERGEREESIFQEKEYQEYEFATFREMTRAYVKIQDGCNEFCSYCKIPFARGRSRSRRPEKVLEEIDKLLVEGFREIILIGINLGDYGKDLKEEINFEDLVRNILKKDLLQRVRIGSVYPDRITESFMTLFDHPKMMPHLHISLQSCDDTVLRNMRRNYGKDVILKTLFSLRKKVPMMEYTADVIVGFPGETEEMFQNTYDSLEKIGFSQRERVGILENLQKKIEEDRRKYYLGKRLEVLIEEEKDGYWWGYSPNYLRVKIRGKNLSINSMVQVKVEQVEKGVLVAYEYAKSL